MEHFDFDFLMKVDTDTYVDVQGMIDYLLRFKGELLYAGVLGYVPFIFYIDHLLFIKYKQ